MFSISTETKTPLIGRGSVIRRKRLSTTHYLICTECKVALWIGQNSAYDPPYIYGGEEYDKKIRDFLIEHARHKIKFDSEHSFNNNLYGPYEYKVFD